MGKTLFRITTVPMAFKVLLPDQIKFMKHNGFDVVMLSADGVERNDVIKNEECTHLIVNMTRKMTPFKDLRCLVKLIRLMVAYHPDIVHTHTPKAGLLGMLAAYFSGVKIRIHTVAGLPLVVEKGIKRKLLMFTEKITYRCATNIWPNSPSLKNFIIENHLTQPEKVRMIGNGSTNGINLEKFSRINIDKNRSEKLKESLKAGNKLVLLYVGRIVKDKGIEDLINAFSRLRQDFSLHLILVGPFEKTLDPISEKTSSEISANKDISHIPWSDSVADFMAISDILVHPSHREGFPNVILQAGAMKLPVVCSDIPGNTDIISDDQLGFVFRVKDENDLYNTLIEAIQNKNKRELFAKELHEKVTLSYDQKKIHQLILENYNQLIRQNEKK